MEMINRKYFCGPQYLELQVSFLGGKAVSAIISQDRPVPIKPDIV